MQPESSERSLASPVGRVVVTLTGSGGKRLTALARCAGWQANLWPGLTFVPVQERVAELANLGHYRWLLLTSPQGVRSLIGGLADLGQGPEALLGLRVAAVGEGTAQHLAAWGRAADFVPAQADARTLAAQLPAQSGELILHVTGQDSRDQLRQGLKNRGLEYQRLALYRSCAVTYSAEARSDLLAADYVVVASGVAARGLAEQLGLGLPLLAMGEQTAQAARAVGFGWVEQAQSPSVEGLLRSLNSLAPRPPV
ncbi:uroporphyrinogen-III synthase [Deinococcus piscis]|nr:uroporphyrinogen-III synthase [Deinococcus piscis]